jgi:hypothetical protein
LAQRDVDAFRDQSNFGFRERIRSKMGNEPIEFGVGDHRRAKFGRAGARASLTSAAPEKPWAETSNNVS